MITADPSTAGRALGAAAYGQLPPYTEVAVLDLDQLDACGAIAFAALTEETNR